MRSLGRRNRSGGTAFWTVGRRGTLALAVAGAFAGSLLVGGLVLAAGSDPARPIHACYQRHSGALRVRTGRRCRRGERALAWSRQGPPGPPGPPGPLPATLPSGKTLRGYFMVNAESKNVPAYGQISFEFPLLAFPHIEILASPSTSAHCSGTEQDPQAASGYLCVYYVDPTNLDALTPADSSRFGTTLIATPANANGSPVATFGSWAVTAP